MLFLLDLNTFEENKYFINKWSKMKIEKAVAEILLNEWDPIGLKDDSNANLEYNQYALRIVGMLYNGTTEGKVAEYLNTVVTDEIGSKNNDVVSKSIAKKFLI